MVTWKTCCANAKGVSHKEATLEPADGSGKSVSAKQAPCTTFQFIWDLANTQLK